ncbi:hypothetical protein [Pedobacter paludis]|uniref:Uncharacterized protein n=1 Tax=Pedobacter paludis TaxID=2203212 RepID=A0A317F564_9SPHI|nr:hypothetical protein [Pedobacter paludis]PWS32636.1 hypothetical protein DF947_06065 [Pedobacter paludis]
MRKKYSNIGQWQAVSFKQDDQFILRVKALLPTQNPGANCFLRKMASASQPEVGLVLRLDGSEHINVESAELTYICYKEVSNEPFAFRNVIVVSFINGSKSSSFIAATDILERGNGCGI